MVLKTRGLNLVIIKLEVVVIYSHSMEGRTKEGLQILNKKEEAGSQTNA